MNEVKPGLVGVIKGYLERYMESQLCVTNLRMPVGTLVTGCKGVGITAHLNHLSQILCDHEQAEWLWAISDDCVFCPDLLEKLYNRDVDVIVPLIASDKYPYDPEIYDSSYQQVTIDWLKDKSGLVESDMLFSWRGMLIRKSVLKEMVGPWFINGATLPEVAGSDLWFCEQLHKKGIKVYLDMENTMGRIAHVSWWPSRLADGAWQAKVHASLPWGWIH